METEIEIHNPYSLPDEYRELFGELFKNNQDWHFEKLSELDCCMVSIETLKKCFLPYDVKRRISSNTQNVIPELIKYSFKLLDERSIRIQELRVLLGQFDLDYNNGDITTK